MLNLCCLFMTKSEDKEVTGKPVEQISTKTAVVVSLHRDGEGEIQWNKICISLSLLCFGFIRSSLQERWVMLFCSFISVNK